MASNPRNLLVLFLVLLPALCAHAQTRTAIPTLHDYVTDLTGTLSAPERAAFNDRLRRFDDSTSTQIVVVMIPTIGQDALEEVSLKIVESNRVGQEKKDNGVLLLIVKNDRLLRIEVGYGLEGVLTDALSAQITRREITPRFREGDFAGGIDAGIEAIMKATRNEYMAEPKSKKEKGLPVSFIVFMIILFIVISRMRRKSRFTGGIFPPIGGGWGGGGSSWGGGGGFGGGGFSGGGGSFGGGGSSGSW